MTHPSDGNSWLGPHPPMSRGLWQIINEHPVYRLPPQSTEEQVEAARRYMERQFWAAHSYPWGVASLPGPGPKVYCAERDCAGHAPPLTDEQLGIWMRTEPSSRNLGERIGWAFARLGWALVHGGARIGRAWVRAATAIREAF